MRPIKPNSRRRSPGTTVLLGIGAIVAGGAVTVLLLGFTKVIDFDKLAFWRKSQVTHGPGWVAVPLSAKTIPAYTEVTREYLMNAKTGAPEVKWYPPDRAPHLAAEGVITDMSRVLGRVTKREMPAVYFFHESDFLPAGSSPGIAGATPRGKRAFTLDATKLKGCVFALKPGDHVDLLASIPVDMPGAGHSNSGAVGTSVLATPDVLLLPKRSFVKPLVQDGVVMTPVTTRVVPITNSSVMNGTTVRNMQVKEIVIAVAPEEVGLLSEAMDMRYDITCDLRSGLAEPRPTSAARRPSGATSSAGVPFLAALGKALLGQSSGGKSDHASRSAPATIAEPAKGDMPPKDHLAADITPGLNPLANVRFMEVRIGSKIQYFLFNGPGNGPVVAAESDESAQPAASPSAASPPAGAAQANKQ